MNIGDKIYVVQMMRDGTVEHRHIDNIVRIAGGTGGSIIGHNNRFEQRNMYPAILLLPTVLFPESIPTIHCLEDQLEAAMREIVVAYYSALENVGREYEAAMKRAYEKVAEYLRSTNQSAKGV